VFPQFVAVFPQFVAVFPQFVAFSVFFTLTATNCGNKFGRLRIFPKSVKFRFNGIQKLNGDKSDATHGAGRAANSHALPVFALRQHLEAAQAQSGALPIVPVAAVEQRAQIPVEGQGSADAAYRGQKRQAVRCGL
jgi:hypothetical protein